MYEPNDAGGDYLKAAKSELINKLRARFDAKLSDTSSMLTFAVEAQKSLDMVSNRLLSMVNFSKKWRQRNYRGAIAEVLRAQRFKSERKEAVRRRRLEALMRQPRKYHRSKSLGSAWLETWFGWLPTVGDITKSLEVLDREIPVEYWKVSTSHQIDWKTVYDEGRQSGHQTGYLFGQMGAYISVTNPNLYLASQLGLTNPVMTAVEIVPWSWLAGWVVNLDQYFRQFSVYHGVTVDHPWYLYGARTRCSATAYYTDQPPRIGEQECLSFERRLGIPGVTLRFKGLNKLSPTRGATLASLLVQYLK